MILVKANKDSEAGAMPEEKLLAAMATYHEELAKAGALLDATGLQPSSKGFRVKYSGAKRTVVDGPFTETKELIAGSTLIQVKSNGPSASPIPVAKDRTVRSRFVSCSSWRTSVPARRSSALKTLSSARRSSRGARSLRIPWKRLRTMLRSR
jgi:hypothetical protein